MSHEPAENGYPATSDSVTPSQDTASSADGDKIELNGHSSSPPDTSQGQDATTSVQCNDASNKVRENCTENSKPKSTSEPPLAAAITTEEPKYRATRLGWNPSMSLLELAFKLKRAERNVFGIAAAMQEPVPSHIAKNSARHRPVWAEGRPMRPAYGYEPYSAGRDLMDFERVPCGEGSIGRWRREGPWPSMGYKPEPVPKMHGPDWSAQRSMISILRPDAVSGAHYRGQDVQIPVPVSQLNQDAQMLGGSDLMSSESSSAKRPRLHDDNGAQPLQIPSDDGDSPNQKRYRHTCSQCSYVTDNLSHLHRHFELVHCAEMPRRAAVSTFAGSQVSPAGERLFNCDQCNYSTRSVSHLRRHHDTIHTKVKPFRCYVCGQEFARSEKVRSHFVSFHPDVEYIPRQTRKFAPPVPQPRESYGGSDYRTRIRDLFRDIEGEDVESVTADADRPYGCLRCSYTARDLWHLRRHVSDVHTTRKNHNCCLCRYATNRSNRLFAHMRSHGEIFCENCDYSSTQPEVFAAHERLCSAAVGSGNGFRCRVCFNKCGDRAGLQLHMSDAHAMELQTCPMCPFYADIGEEFVAHMDAHVLVDRTCKLCDVAFETSAAHDSHDDQTHLGTNDAGLMCIICGAPSEPRGDLLAARAHVRSHSPIAKPCTDLSCSFKCRLSTSLDVHIKSYHEADEAGNARLNYSGDSSQNTTLNVINPVIIDDSNTTEDIKPFSSFRQGSPGVMMPINIMPENITPSPSKPKITIPNCSPLVGTFACAVCGIKRPPFKYWRSYEKHMAQHGIEATYASC